MAVRGARDWGVPGWEDLVVFFVRLLLGLFASAALSGVGYGLGWLVSLSISLPTSATVIATAVVSGAIGAGVGAYAVWLVADVPLWRHLMNLLVVVLAAAGGGVGGLWYGGRVEKPVLLGIPELGGIMTGATIAATVMALGLRVLRWAVRAR